MPEIKIKMGDKAVIVGTLIPVGSRDEADNIKGVSHFVEHSLFKGTKNRTKNEITRTAEQYGAQFNAWTSEEHTFYYMTISGKYRMVARDIIDDMVQNAIFPVEEIDKEREVIIQELQMYEDNPQSDVFAEAQRVMYNEGSGLRIPIIGTRETLANITRDTLAKYYEQNYKRGVQLEIGAVDEARNKIILPCRFNKESLDFSTTDHIVTRKGINQANMVMTGLLHKTGAEDNQNLNLLHTVLSGFQGRLFQTVREENHLVYTCRFYAQAFSCGTVQYWVYAALNADKIKQAQNLIQQELTRPVTQEEYDFSKRKYLGETELSLDSKSNACRVVIDAILNNEDYDDQLVNYVNQIPSLPQLNAYIKKSDFSHNKLVAITPA